LQRQALRFAAEQPSRELALVPARVYHLFRGDHVWQAWYPPGTPRFLPSESARRTLGRIGDAYYAIVAVLALIGCAAAGTRDHAGWRLLKITLATWIAVFAAVYGDPRFHHVLVPPACLLAAASIATWSGARGEVDAARAA
jgi:hypothetical protein